MQTECASVLSDLPSGITFLVIEVHPLGFHFIRSFGDKLSQAVFEHASVISIMLLAVISSVSLF